MPVAWLPLTFTEVTTPEVTIPEAARVEASTILTVVVPPGPPDRSSTATNCGPFPVPVVPELGPPGPLPFPVPEVDPPSGSGENIKCGEMP